MKRRLLTILLAILFFMVLEGSTTLHNGMLYVVGNIFPERNGVKTSARELAFLSVITDLTKENEKLRAEISLRRTTPTIPAHIIFGGGYLFTDTLIVDKGTEDGVLPTDWVIANDTTIGYIGSNNARESIVILFSRFKEPVIVRLGEKKDVVLEGEGVGGGEIRIELPQGFGILVGDPVWLAKKNNYLIGLISAVDVQKGRLINYAYIRNPFSLRSLNNVTIMRP